MLRTPETLTGIHNLSAADASFLSSYRFALQLPAHPDVQALPDAQALRRAYKVNPYTTRCATSYISCVQFLMSSCIMINIIITVYALTFRQMFAEEYFCLQIHNTKRKNRTGHLPCDIFSTLPLKALAKPCATGTPRPALRFAHGFLALSGLPCECPAICPCRHGHLPGRLKSLYSKYLQSGYRLISALEVSYHYSFKMLF